MLPAVGNVQLAVLVLQAREWQDTVRWGRQSHACDRHPAHLIAVVIDVQRLNLANAPSLMVHNQFARNLARVLNRRCDVHLV